MRNLKRGLCAFLTVLLLSTNTLAVLVPGGGSNQVGSSSGKSTNFSTLYNVGVAVGLQNMSDSKFLITPSDKANATKLPKTRGLANVTEHFAYSYPNPYAAYGNQALVYVLPNTGTTPKYATATGNGVGQVPLQSWFYASAGSDVGNVCHNWEQE